MFFRLLDLQLALRRIQLWVTSSVRNEIVSPVTAQNLDHLVKNLNRTGQHGSSSMKILDTTVVILEWANWCNDGSYPLISSVWNWRKLRVQYSTTTRNSRFVSEDRFSLAAVIPQRDLINIIRLWRDGATINGPVVVLLANVISWNAKLHSWWKQQEFRELSKKKFRRWKEDR